MSVLWSAICKSIAAAADEAADEMRGGYITEGDYAAANALTAFGRAMRRRDSDGTATAAVCEDIPVPQDCQARPNGIARKPHP